MSKKAKLILGAAAILGLAALGGAFDDSSSDVYIPVHRGGYGYNGGYVPQTRNYHHHNWYTGTHVVGDGETIGVVFDDGTSVISGG